MIVECLEDGAENALRDCSAHFDRVIAVHQNLWLDDRHKTVELRDRRIASQRVSAVLNRQLTWHTMTDLQNVAPFHFKTEKKLEYFSLAGFRCYQSNFVLPFGESSAFLVVAFRTLVQIVETLRRSFALRAANIDGTLVGLDASHDAE